MIYTLINAFLYQYIAFKYISITKHTIFKMSATYLIFSHMPFPQHLKGTSGPF